MNAARHPIAVLVAALVAAAPAGAASPALREAGDSKFPARSWILTLPEARDLGPGDVTLYERGREVAGLTVQAAGAAGNTALGSVLAIDASESMRGAPIAAAMDAARAFAAERRPNQPLGVIFFSRESRTALAPTTDGAKISRLLAHPPTLSKGTQFYDAAMAGLTELEKARIDSGTVVVLSDGADAGSDASAPDVAAVARAQRAQVFTVGLRSASYSGRALEELATAAGGQHTTASGAELRGVFAALGVQLANQYIVRYRSVAPLESTVSVEARVAGLPDAIVASYDTPKLPAMDLPAVRDRGGAASVPAVAAIVALLTLLIGLFAWLLFRRPARTVEDRVGDYGRSRPRVTGRTRTGRLAPDRARKRGAWFTRLAEDLELGGVDVAPGQVLLATVGGTALLAWFLAAVADRGVAAVIVLLAPVFALMVLRSRVERRRRAFADQLADTLQVVSSAMRAGHSFASALAVALEDADEPTRSELGRVVRDDQLGVPIEQATAEVGRRMENREVEQVGLVAALQRESGGNTAEVIDHLTDTIRERDGLRRQVRALTAQGRTAGAALTALPVGLAAFFSVTSPDYFGPMLEASSGVFLLVLCVVLIAAGWLAIRKIVDIKI